MEKETSCSVCGATFVVKYPKYISEEEDPSVLHGVELRLTLGKGRVLIKIAVCKSCIGNLIMRFSDEGSGMREFLQFVGATPVEEPAAVEEVESSEDQDVPSEDVAPPPEPKEEIFDEEMLEKMDKEQKSNLEAGDILTEEALKALEEEPATIDGWKVEDLREGDILTEEALARMEAEDGG